MPVLLLLSHCQQMFFLQLTGIHTLFAELYLNTLVFVILNIVMSLFLQSFHCVTFLCLFYWHGTVALSLGLLANTSFFFLSNIVNKNLTLGIAYKHSSRISLTTFLQPGTFKPFLLIFFSYTHVLPGCLSIVKNKSRVLHDEIVTKVVDCTELTGLIGKDTRREARYDFGE